MARKSNGIAMDLLDLVAESSWWVGVFLAFFFFALLRFILPSFDYSSPTNKVMVQAGKALSPFSFVFLLAAGYSAIRSFDKRRLLDRQSGIDSIRSLSWKEFEELLGEAYRRRGYCVLENVEVGPDGGVDLRIEKDGNSYLVQCKQWKAFKVPVGVVREMYGLMVAEKANGVHIVTSGMFTQEARTFADGKPIDLIEGQQLADMIRNAQPRDHASSPLPSSPAAGEPDGSAPKLCPLCGKELVLREARRGIHSGKKFWGCNGYPACKYIRQYETKGQRDRSC